MKKRLIAAFAGLALAACGGGSRLGSPALPPLAEPAPAAAVPAFEEANASPVSVSPAALSLLGTGTVSAKTVRVSEAKYKGAFTEVSTCKNVATAKPASGKGPVLAVLVTAIGAGSCKIAFSDALGHRATLAIEGTTASTRIPAGAISTRSKSATITLTSVDGKTPPAGIVKDVTVALPSCAAGCTIAAPQSPPGSDTYALRTFDALGGKGNALAAGSARSAVVGGKANAILAAFAGIPKSIAFGSVPAATAGTAFTAPKRLAIAVKDADGTTIVGAYAVAVKIADADASAIAQGSGLALNGHAAARLVQVVKSSDAVAVAYGGLAIAPVTLTASAAGTSGATARFAPSIAGVAYSGPRNAGQPEIDLYNPSSGQPGYSGSFTASQAGWSAAPFSRDFTYTTGGHNNNCASFVITPGSGQGQAFTARVGASPVAGTCLLTVTGATSASTQLVTLTYTTNSVGVSVRKATQP